MNTIASQDPTQNGFTMPARFGPHQRSFVGWPRDPIDYRVDMDMIKTEHAAVARAIARFEPCTIIADPDDATEVLREFADDDNIDVLTIACDDGWIRDNGPIFVTHPDGRMAMVDFAFNGWGEYPIYQKDNAVPLSIADALGVERFVSSMVLEGGGFGVDGEGTLITNEQCMLNPNRNPGMTRYDIERELHRTLGVEKVIWLGYGLVEDSGTDGHVDNNCQFLEPGVVLLQTLNSSLNPNYPGVEENRRRLKGARDANGRKLEVIEIDILPYTSPNTWSHYPVPYVNYYIVNGGVIMPALGGAEDDLALPRLEKLFPGREIVPVETIAMAIDGGGIGCITQQMPAPAKGKTD